MGISLSYGQKEPMKIYGIFELFSVTSFYLKFCQNKKLRPVSWGRVTELQRDSWFSCETTRLPWSSMYSSTTGGSVWESKPEVAPPPHPPSPGEMCAVGVIPIARLPEPSFPRDLSKAASRCKFPDKIYLLSFELVRTALRSRVRLLLTRGEWIPCPPNWQ